MKSERIQEAEAESEKIRNTVKSETEAFVSNIPFNFYAKDLVEFFVNKLKSLGKRESLGQFPFTFKFIYFYVQYHTVYL